MCEFSKQQHTQYVRKKLAHRFNKLARKGLTKLLKSKKGHNSVEIKFRVMGLDIQGHLMTLSKFVKFQCDSIPSVQKGA